MNRRSAPQNRGGILPPEAPNAECVSGWGSRQVWRDMDTILIGRLAVVAHMPFVMRNYDVSRVYRLATGHVGGQAESRWHHRWRL